MTTYRIISKDNFNYSMSGNFFHINKTYEEQKKYHFMPNSIAYGDRLAEYKSVKSGFSIKVKLYFRNHWYWLPKYNWKFGKYFHWLFFMIWLESEYCEVFNCIIKDHLNEQEQHNDK